MARYRTWPVLYLAMYCTWPSTVRGRVLYYTRTCMAGYDATAVGSAALCTIDVGYGMSSDYILGRTSLTDFVRTVQQY